MKLDHLRRLTDDTGMLQHAIFTIPNRAEGYTTDDNARALILAVLLGNGKSAFWQGRFINGNLGSPLFGIPGTCLQPDESQIQNFLRYDRRWNEPIGSEDSHGRALWAIGTVLGRSQNDGLRGAAGRLFEFSLPAALEFSSPRAWAYTLLGIQEYLDSYPGDRDAQKVQSSLSRRLLEMYESIRRPDWKWFENVVAYGNARLPQAYFSQAQLARMTGWFLPASNPSIGYPQRNTVKSTATLFQSVRKASIA